MRFKKWLILGVLAVLVAALLVPAASVAADVGSNTLYLSKHKKDYLLVENLPDKGGRHVNSPKIDPEKTSALDYKELGTWQSWPVTSASRIINLGAANLWLRADIGKEEVANVQIKVDVLKNGNVEVSRETGVITLTKELVPVAVDLPAPLTPGIELAVGGVWGLRVSVRDGGSLQPDTHYKVRLDYDGAKTPSNLTFETAGPTPAAGMIEIGQPSFIAVDGTIYVTGETPITIDITSGFDISQTTITLSSPEVGPITVPAGTGLVVIHLTGAPLGNYTIRVDAVTLSGETRSDLLEVTLVNVLPTS